MFRLVALLCCCVPFLWACRSTEAEETSDASPGSGDAESADPDAPEPADAPPTDAPPAAETSEAAAAFEAGLAQMRERKYVEARLAFEVAASAAEVEGDTSLQVEALAQVARTSSILGEPDVGRPWLERAGALATTDEPLGWARWMLVRGVYEREDGDRERAVATFEELYRFCTERELHERAIDAAHMIAIAAPPEEQIVWAERGIAAAEAAGAESWLAVLWNNLGNTYDDLERLEEALDAFERARTYHHRVGTEHAQRVADWAVGRAHRRLGHTAEARLWLEPVAATFARLHDEEPGPGTGEWLGYALWELGEVNLLEGQRVAARGDLQQARELLVDAGIATWWSDGLAALDASLARTRE